MRKTIAKLYSRPLVRDMVKTTMFSTIGKAVGFLIPFFIAAWFGVSGKTDAFFFAYGIILFLSGVLSPVIESVIVPYVAEFRQSGQDVGKFIGNILSISSIYILLLTVLFLFVIKPILGLLTKFDDQTLKLVYQILLEMSPLIILLFWTSVLSGTLNTYKRFAFPAIAPGIRAVVNLIFIFIFKNKYGVHSIAFGYVAGEIVRLFFLLVAIKHLRLLKLYLDFHHNEKLRSFFKTASYQMIGMIAGSFNPIVDQTMASWLGEGSVSILSYADRLYMIPISFMTTGIMVTILSHWSERYFMDGMERLKKDVSKTLLKISYIALPITVLLIAFHQPIVKLAFGRHAFEKSMLAETGKVWVCYLLGFWPYVLCQIYVKGYLVLKNTKILMLCGIYMNILNIILNFILMKFFGVAGIALATAMVLVIMLIFLERRWSRV